MVTSTKIQRSLDVIIGLAIYRLARMQQTVITFLNTEMLQVAAS